MSKYGEINMTNEEKDLLLKDLCARLAYNVQCCAKNNHKISGSLVGIIGENIHVFSSGHGIFSINVIKPYLLPLSSMTKEQEKEWSYTLSSDYNITYDTIDWLNKNHFDYRGLIDKGLAIDATNLNIY